MARRTRKSTTHWLIGTEDSQIMGCKLPSTRQVLRFFLYQHFTCKKAVHESARVTTQAVLRFWEQAHINAADDRNIVSKIEKIYNAWIKLKKSRSREKSSPSFIDKMEIFKDKLDALFDVAHKDVFKLVTIPEDIEFLIAQREKNRRGCMLRIDRNLALKTFRKQRRLEAIERRNLREEEMRKLRFRRATVDEGDNDDDSMATDSDDDFDAEKEKTKRKRGASKRKSVICNDYLAMLDRSKMSLRKAAAVTLTVMGAEASSTTMSKSTLHRKRFKFRDEVNEEEALAREIKRSGPLTVHWDGKILPDLTGQENVDRLPVLVTSGDNEWLLGVPKLQSGSGRNQAVAVTDLLRKYGLENQLIGAVFDTTGSNSGREKGACICIEEILGLKLLWLACRHHVLEIVLKDVFHLCLGPNKGPTFRLFERFRTAWKDINPANFESFKDDTVIPPDERTNILAFCSQQLEEHQPRDDYKRLLWLTKAFLGANPEGRGITAPNPVSDARWMEKASNCLCIYLAKGQFKLTPYEDKGVLRFCLFVVRIYNFHWFTCQQAITAPENDLLLVKKLQRYASVDERVSQTASAAIGRHLWYLGHDLIALSFFSDTVPVETKRDMVKALKNNTGTASSTHRFDVSSTSKVKITDVASRNLPDFVVKSTKRFFEITRLPVEFLEKDPIEWEEEDSYKEGKKLVKNLEVVNDCAERGVALIKEFTNAGLTKDESQLQCLLKIVKKSRKELPKLDKAEIIAHMNRSV